MVMVVDRGAVRTMVAAHEPTLRVALVLCRVNEGCATLGSAPYWSGWPA